MKRLPILSIALITFFFSCKKSATTTYMSTGVINGPLNGYLGGSFCYGNYWIKINDSEAYSTFNTLPAGSGINPDSASFAHPINVKVNWHNSTGCLSVVIDAIERVD